MSLIKKFFGNKTPSTPSDAPPAPARRRKYPKTSSTTRAQLRGRPRKGETPEQARERRIREQAEEEAVPTEEDAVEEQPAEEEEEQPVYAPPPTTWFD